jgi:hypothetical protein
MQNSDKASGMLDEVRAEIAQLTASLPQKIDLLGLSARYKTAGKVHMLRESLFWRMEELSRNTLALLDAGDLVAAALVARAVMETTAAIVYLHKLVERGIRDGVTADLDDKLTGFLTGSRIWEDLGGAINVLTMIDAVEKAIPGYRRHYESLCEYAHPNWSGAFGAYGATDQKELTVAFTREGRCAENNRKIIIGMLAGSVGLFNGYYNFLADMLVPFAKAVEAFYDANKAAAKGTDDSAARPS